MVRQAGVAAVVFLASAVGLVVAADAASIDTIMGKTFGGKKAAVKQLPELVKGEKWDDAKKMADTMAGHAADLGKNKPPKGAADSWKKLSDEYAAQAKAVADAVGKKDAKGVTQALEKFTEKGNCKTCHEKHQPD